MKILVIHVSTRISPPFDIFFLFSLSFFFLIFETSKQIFAFKLFASEMKVQLCHVLTINFLA